MGPCIDHGQKGNKDGYGKCCRYVDGKAKYPLLHREVFLQHNGYLPQVVMHSCDNPRCINPEHLLPGTFALNNKDRANRGRSHGTIKGAITDTVKAAWVQDTRSAAIIAKEYGVSPSYVQLVRKVAGYVYTNEYVNQTRPRKHSAEDIKDMCTSRESLAELAVRYATTKQYVCRIRKQYRESL